MKKICLIVLLVFCLLLSGCGGRAVQAKFDTFSAELSQREELRFTAVLRAEYEEKTVDFTLRYEQQGDERRITVLEPALVAGISAAVREGGTQLEFDGVILDTGPLDSYGLSPLASLPLLVDTMAHGHLDSFWEDGGETVLQLVPDDHSTVQVWFDEKMVPTHAELFSDGTVTVVCDIRDWS